MTRLLHKSELYPLPSGFVLQALPLNYFIINPTPEELKIIELYAAEVRKMNLEIEELRYRDRNIND